MDAPLDLATVQLIGGAAIGATVTAGIYFHKMLVKFADQMSTMQIGLLAKLAEADAHVESKIDRKIDEVWNTINLNDRAAQEHRTNLLTALREIPTRREMQAGEARIMEALDRALRLRAEA